MEILKKVKICMLCCVVLWACHDSEDLEPEYAERTVIVYMAADNSLNDDGYNNIQAMLRGMKQTSGRVVIYFDPKDDVPRLLTIRGGKDCKLDTLVTYKEENSAAPEVLARVVEEARKRYPASSYGLILWSHGMGWLPPNYSFPGAVSFRLPGENMPRTKYYAQDNHVGENGGDAYMDIKEMAELLPGHFSYIMWDVCFMGGIEVAYELRHKTDYMIASPAEVIADGFPYESVMPLLWGGEEELKQVCREFYDKYNEYVYGGDWCSATVSLVKMSGLEALAVKARDILKGRTDFADAWSYPLSKPFLPDVFFDLGDYMKQMTSESEYESFRKQLDKVVIYKAATKNFFGHPIPVDKFSGLSSYIPFQKWDRMNTYYYTLDWGRTVYDNN